MSHYTFTPYQSLMDGSNESTPNPSYLAQMRERQERMRAQQNRSEFVPYIPPVPSVSPISSISPVVTPVPLTSPISTGSVVGTVQQQLRERQERLRLQQERVRLEQEERKREIQVQKELENLRIEEQMVQEIIVSKTFNYIVNYSLPGLIDELKTVNTFTEVNELLGKIREILNSEFDKIPFLELDIVKRNINRLHELFNQIVVNINENPHLLATFENNVERQHMSELINQINRMLGINLEVPIEIKPDTSRDMDFTMELHRQFERERAEQEERRLQELELQQFERRGREERLFQQLEREREQPRLISFDEIQSRMRSGRIVTFEKDPMLQSNTRYPNTILTFYDTDGQVYYVEVFYNSTTNVMNSPISFSLTPFHQIVNMLESNEIRNYEINPDIQSQSPSPNNIMTFNGTNGKIYFANVRYDPKTNQIFPPV